MKRNFLIFTALALLAGAFYLAVSVKNGWQDFSFRLNDAITLKRTGPSEIYLYRPEGIIRPSAELGPVFEVASDGRVVYAKHYGFKGGEVDPDKTALVTVPLDGGGPSCEAGEQVPPALEWKSVRQAHKEALRAGRADYGEVDRYFLGQVGFLCANLHFIALYSLLPGFLLGSWLRRKEKPRPFVTGWLACLGSIAGVIVLISFFGWLDMRFF